MVSALVLKSRVTGIPDLVVGSGRSLILGRNRVCRIKKLACPRRHTEVKFPKTGPIARFLKSGKSIPLENNSTLSGPGFEYTVKIQENNQVKWEDLFDGDLIVGQFLGGGTSSFIAAFDLDQTLITPQSGKAFPQDENDWKFLSPQTPNNVRTLVEQYGFNFVIISNQLGISLKKQCPNQLKRKLERILVEIGVPCTVFFAPKDNRFRKPMTGVWEYICQRWTVNKPKSFFVGDSAGRKKNGKNGKADHSVADLLFAYNNRIAFMTPEKLESQLSKESFAIEDQTQHFLQSVDIFSGSKVKSASVLMVDSSSKEPFDFSSLPSGQHCILLCGLQATGKSTFYANHLRNRGYEHVSRDVLKTMDKCKAAMRKLLEEGKSCVIDNTNLLKTQREDFIRIARQFNLPCFLFLFEIPIEHIFHNLKFRLLTQKDHSEVNKIAVYSARKNYQEPSLEEGFERIIRVNFDPTFGDESSRELYSKFLLDK